METEVVINRGSVVGHVSLQDIFIAKGRNLYNGAFIGPLIVNPQFTSSSEYLIEAAIAELLSSKSPSDLSRSRYEVVIALGNSIQYDNFGMIDAKPFNIRWWSARPKSIKIKQLVPGALKRIANGTVKKSRYLRRRARALRK
ncbi:hypothetical protein AAMO2058_001357400 [Amorphochlora amoebiformis]